MPLQMSGAMKHCFAPEQLRDSYARFLNDPPQSAARFSIFDARLLASFLRSRRMSVFILLFAAFFVSSSS